MATIASIASTNATMLGEEYTGLDVRESFDTWTAEAINELINMEDWPFMTVRTSVSSVATQAVYSPPSTANLWNLNRIVEAGQEPLTQTTREALVDDGRDLDEAGTPTYWYPAGVTSSGIPQFGLWPVPSSEVTYVLLGTAIKNYDGVADRETSLPLPPDIVSLLGYLVRERFYLHSVDPTGFQKAQSERGQFLRALRNIRHRHMSWGDRVRRARRTDIGVLGGTFLRMPDNIS